MLQIPLFPLFRSLDSQSDFYKFGLSTKTMLILSFFASYRDLEGNKISFIHEDSFSGFLQLEDL